jgi:hypothetical protein
MAADLRSGMPASPYREIVLRGPQGWTQGYLAGYLRGSGLAAAIYDAEREGFDCAGLRERVHDMLVHEKETIHLLVPEEAEGTVRAAAETAPDLALEASRPLRGARFGFAFRTYSPEHARRIGEDFRHPPAGASLLPGARFEERRSQEAIGLELKGADHAYELEAEGEVEGEVPAVIGLYRRYRGEELVQLGPLRLLYADAAS